MAGSGMRKLAKDTAIYGLSSIIGKFLNWCLVPMYTRVLDSTAEYGVVTNLYAWTALLMVLLTYGMETGFFRFANKKEEDPTTVYSTSLISLGFTSILFVILCWTFITPISIGLGYENYPQYLRILAAIVAIDAFSSIPFAYLRYTNRPIRFASIKLLFIFLNILLNLFFLLLCPYLYKNHPQLVDWFYQENSGVWYIFVSNFIATFIMMLALLPELTGFRYKFNKALLKRMLRYSLPILALGVMGIFNQTADKIIFPFLFSDRTYADEQLGIYGACFKIGVVMIMFAQAFRFAYEPFIFAKNRQENEDNKKAYAEVMKYFIIFGLFIFLGVMFFIDILKYFVDASYFEGIRVVPIVMLGELFFGIYFNLSFWYKLIDKTQYGAYFSAIGSIITVVIIILFAPVYGYMACAWASFCCNLIMMLISYFVGQKMYPIRYDLKSAGIYFLLAISLYLTGMNIPVEFMPVKLLLRSCLLGIFLLVVIKRDVPLKNIPFINKYVKK
ncbi:MAG: oligosaccharide flippase family protein [Candidatus Azobacteroides sp.]|nr:oligosaccharide flippase family protein [Candidatus Azobacteroides sp.]